MRIKELVIAELRRKPFLDRTAHDIRREVQVPGVRKSDVNQILYALQRDDMATKDMEGYWKATQKLKNATDEQIRAWIDTGKLNPELQEA